MSAPCMAPRGDQLTVAHRCVVLRPRVILFLEFKYKYIMSAPSTVFCFTEHWYQYWIVSITTSRAATVEVFSGALVAQQSIAVGLCSLLEMWRGASPHVAHRRMKIERMYRPYLTALEAGLGSARSLAGRGRMRNCDTDGRRLARSRSIVYWRRLG
jgi:hypothetical protein